MHDKLSRESVEHITKILPSNPRRSYELHLHRLITKLARHSKRHADFVYLAKPRMFKSLQDALYGFGRLLI